MSNKIYVNIIDSNIQEFSPKKIFKLKLLKCVGTGAYGFIFLTNINRYAVKILTGKPKDINNEISDGLTDYTEVDVISRIIERKEEFEINCANYAYGFLLNNEKTTDNKQIKLIVNKDMCVEEVMSEIVRKDKIKKVVFYENNYVIIMPMYVTFNDYVKTIGVNFFKNEKVIYKIIDNLVKSVKEMRELDLINMDLKIGNSMLDMRNKMKIIDFGMTKSIDNLNNPIFYNLKYYIWPENGKTYNKTISFMICIFILELLFDSKIYDLQKNKKEIYTFIDLLKTITYLKEEFKELVKITLTDGINFDDFCLQFNIIKGNLNVIELPNIYHFVLYNKGINAYDF